MNLSWCSNCHNAFVLDLLFQSPDWRGIAQRAGAVNSKENRALSNILAPQALKPLKQREVRAERDRVHL